MTDRTETLTSYDLVKKFGDDKHKEKPEDDDESVDFLDCLCLDTAGFVDDMMGLNAENEEEEKDATEDSVVELPPEQQDPDFKRAPKLDPQFVSAPSGPPAILTAKSWDNLIDTGAVKAKDRRMLRKRVRQRLFASTERDEEGVHHHDSLPLPDDDASSEIDGQQDRALELQASSYVKPPTTSKAVRAPRIFVPPSTKSYEEEYTDLFEFDETLCTPRAHKNYEEKYANIFSSPYDEPDSEIIRTPELVVRLGVVRKSSSLSK